MKTATVKKTAVNENRIVAIKLGRLVLSARKPHAKTNPKANSQESEVMLDIPSFSNPFASMRYVGSQMLIPKNKKEHTSMPNQTIQKR